MDATQIPFRGCQDLDNEGINRGHCGLENREPFQMFQDMILNGAEGAVLMAEIEISPHPGSRIWAGF